MLLLFLTGVGPLLAWRKTSTESLKRNFTWPVVAGVATAVLLAVLGFQPWAEGANFYSLMAISLAVLVGCIIAQEFFRGARVIAGHTGQALVPAVVTLARRNTRRYGGYMVP